MIAAGTLQNVPSPEEVRRQLASTVRQAALLRQLLRLSERIQKERTHHSVPSTQS